MNSQVQSNRSFRECNAIINNRKTVSLTGVEEVGSFDENTVILSVAGCTLTVDGHGLNITKLSLETGDVVIDGVIDGLFYSEAKQKKSGFFSRK